jgi:hypothetical protein
LAFHERGLGCCYFGGALGLLLAYASLQTLIRLYPNTMPRTGNITLDPLVLLFTLGVSVGTGLLLTDAAHAQRERERLDHSTQGKGAKRCLERHAITFAADLLCSRGRIVGMLAHGAGLLCARSTT